MFIPNVKIEKHLDINTQLICWNGYTSLTLYRPKPIFKLLKDVEIGMYYLAIEFSMLNQKKKKIKCVHKIQL